LFAEQTQIKLGPDSKGRPAAMAQREQWLLYAICGR